MPISHLSLVNQKLRYASAVIQLLNIANADPNPGHRLQQQALGDAAVFHLAMAVHFYLRELAERNNIKNVTPIHTVQDLNVALEQVGVTSSESLELLSLVKSSGTWLNQLTRYYSQLYVSPEQPKPKKAFGSENLVELIELTAIDETRSLEMNPELISSWIDSFQALIHRQRDTSAEY